MPLELQLRRSDDEIRARFATLQTREDVADLLEIPNALLRRILYVRREPDHYRTFRIRKKSGGQREIAAPPNALSILQAKLNYVFQVVYRRRRATHGFVRGRSILANAALHVGKRWVLNIDIQDFFPSINFGRVRGVFIAPPYSLGSAAATVIAQVCCHDNALPQGAPSSPMVANIVCGRLDGELSALARRHRATYTRYGDDITLSLRQYVFPEELALAPVGWTGIEVIVGPSLRHVVESNGFTINPAKSRLQLKDHRQAVTGITVNVFPNVNRKFVRELRAMIHAWERYGLEEAEREYRLRFSAREQRPGSEARSFTRVVKGKLDFLKMVRGSNDPVYVKYRQALHELDAQLVPPAPTPMQRPVRSISGVGADPGWIQWYRRLGQSVFHLEIDEGGRIFSGTAFAYTTTQLATAGHNLIGRMSVIGVADGNIEPDAIVLHERYEEGLDCGTIQVVHGAPPLTFNTQLPPPGSHVAVIGFASIPLRQPSLGIYPGIVESVPPNYRGTPLIHISVPSAGGLSGSPVVDAQGRVIGILVESSFEQTQSGVPRREFCTVLPIEHLLQSQRLPSRRRTARRD